jgi:hypothetical protein
VLLITDTFSSSFVFVFCAAVEKVGLLLAPRQPDTEDPLMASADSPHVVVDVCRVVAEEEGGGASRPQEAC